MNDWVKISLTAILIIAIGVWLGGLLLLAMLGVL